MLLCARRPWCRWRRYSWKVTDSILDLVGETAGSQGHPRIKMQNMEEVEIFIVITLPCKTSSGLNENTRSSNLKCDDGSGVLLHGHEQGRRGDRGGVHGLLHHQQQLHQQSSGPALESWPQSPKNLGGRVALPSGKFLRVRKDFAHKPWTCNVDFPDPLENF